MKLVAFDSDISLLKRKYKLKALEVWKIYIQTPTPMPSVTKAVSLIALPFDQLQDMN